MCGVCVSSDLKTVNFQTVKIAKKYFTFEFVRKEAVSNPSRLIIVVRKSQPDLSGIFMYVLAFAVVVVVD